MNIEQIKAFITVADEKGLIRASTKLHKTQPAVSFAIKTLEEELGIELFDRSDYRIKLSESGKRIYRKARLLIDQWNNFQKDIKQFSLKVEQNVTFTLDIVVDTDYIAKIINESQQKFPNTEIYINSASLSGTIESVKIGQSAFAITGWDIDILSDAYEYEKLSLMTVNLIPVTSSSHYHSNKELYEHPNALGRFPQIMIKDSTTLEHQAKKGSEQHTHMLYVDNFKVKKQLICQGAGWGLLPEYLATDEINNKILHKLDKPNFNNVYAAIYLIKRKNVVLGPCAEFLWYSLATQLIQNVS